MQMKEHLYQVYWQECYQQSAVSSQPTAVQKPVNSAAMSYFDLKVASAVIVAAAQKMHAETIESLLAEFEFAETASVLAEKGIADVVGAGQEQSSFVDLQQLSQNLAVNWMISWHSKGFVALQQTMEAEKQATGHSDQLGVEREELD